MPENIIIFTDGSSRGNPGPGGYAAVIIFPESDDNRGELKVPSEKFQVREIGGREEHTTNNRMELQAAISALASLSNITGQSSIVVYSDSGYVINGITKWVFGWQKNGWKTAVKKEVENRDLWEALSDAVKGKRISWRQVGGHVGVVGNERCDVIATAFADNGKPALYAGPLSGYAIKNILDISEDSSAVATKSSSSSHSRAKAYSYVSLVDGKIQIHKTWAECEARVKGVRAKFKKAVSESDERGILAEWSR